MKKCMHNPVFMSILPCCIPENPEDKEIAEQFTLLANYVLKKEILKEFQKETEVILDFRDNNDK